MPPQAYDSSSRNEELPDSCKYSGRRDARRTVIRLTEFHSSRCARKRESHDESIRKQLYRSLYGSESGHGVSSVRADIGQCGRDLHRSCPLRYHLSTAHACRLCRRFSWLTESRNVLITDRMSVVRSCACSAHFSSLRLTHCSGSTKKEAKQNAPFLYLSQPFFSLSFVHFFVHIYSSSLSSDLEESPCFVHNKCELYVEHHRPARYRSIASCKASRLTFVFISNLYLRTKKTT